MGLKFNDLSETLKQRIRRDNPTVFAPVGGLQSAKPQQDSGDGTSGAVPRKEHSKRSRGKSRQVCRITLIRICRREIDDEDNLKGGFKWCRDAITRHLGIDDSDKVVKWEYGQTETKGKEGTIIRIELL